MGGTTTGVRAAAGVPVPQPVPGHGDTAPGAPSLGALNPKITQDHVSVGRTFAAFGIGAAAGVVPFLIIGFSAQPGGRGTAILAASTIGLGAVLASVGGVALAKAGHGPLHVTKQVDNPAYDATKVDAAIAAGLVGSTAHMQLAATPTDVTLGRLLGTTTSLESANAPLYEKSVVDGVLAGSQPQRVVITLPAKADADTTTYASYEVDGATRTGASNRYGVDLPKALQGIGLQGGEFTVASALVDHARVSEKPQVRGNEDWTLVGAATTEVRGMGGTPTGVFEQERNVAEGAWKQTGERFNGYVDAEH